MEVRRIKGWAPDDILEHHGIKGQRWGIRRYQNKDGTLTAEGRRRYLSDIDRNSLDTAQYDKDSKKVDEIRKTLLDKQDPSQEERIKDAADTALRAMDRNGDYNIGMVGIYEKEDDATKRSVQDWLVYEDQTIGYAEIADLANQGKSADQIRSTIGEASKAYNGIRESGRQVVEQVAHKYLPADTHVNYETEVYIKEKLGSKEIDSMESLFDLDYVWGDDYYRSKLDPFIDSCVKEAAIKRKGKNKR